MCERLYAMQQQARLPEFLVQNSLTAPTQVFQECWSGVNPPPPKMKIWLDWGTLDLTWSGVSHLITPPMKILLDWGTLDLSWSGVSPQMKIFLDWGTLDLSWSGVSPQMKIFLDWGTLDLSWSGVPPLPTNENLARLGEFGFQLVWSKFFSKMLVCFFGTCIWQRLNSINVYFT